MKILTKRFSHAIGQRLDDCQSRTLSPRLSSLPFLRFSPARQPVLQLHFKMFPSHIVSYEISDSESSSDEQSDSLEDFLGLDIKYSVRRAIQNCPPLPETTTQSLQNLLSFPATVSTPSTKPSISHMPSCNLSAKPAPTSTLQDLLSFPATVSPPSTKPVISHMPSCNLSAKSEATSTLEDLLSFPAIVSTPSTKPSISHMPSCNLSAKPEAKSTLQDLLSFPATVLTPSTKPVISHIPSCTETTSTDNALNDIPDYHSTTASTSTENCLDTPDQHLTTEQTEKSKKYALDFKLLPTSMQNFLKDVKLYFTKPINLQRQRPPVAESTFGKARERILCFLGFAKNILSLELTPELFLRHPVIEEYLTYLKVERRLNPCTIANHAAAFIYPAKFLHAEDSPQYNNVAIIQKIRGQVSSLQRDGNRQRASAKEDLIEKNSWLDWDEIVNSVGRQRERMEMARTAKAKAEECADLLLISLYVLVPPSRACEIRTLEIVPHDANITSPDMAGRNLVRMQEDGGLTFRFQRYKTVKTYGSDTTILKNDHELSRILRDYVDNHRAKLITQDSGNFLLVNAFGKPYSGSAFTSRIKFLFHRLTGVSLSVNGLRSSFVTHTYGMSDCSDSLKDSVAAALRHSRKQAQQTYDRRNSNERKHLALSLCSDLAQEETVDGTDPEDSPGNQTSLKVGDFVGLIEEGSTLDSPKVMIGRILSFQSKTQASLLWFKPCGKEEYVFEFGDEPWLESLNAMMAVKMRPLKRKPGVFKLSTSLKSIHEAFQ